MFIIPASVVAKIMMAVTISLHPAAHHAPASYTVHQGDTLSAPRWCLVHSSQPVARF